MTDRHKDIPATIGDYKVVSRLGSGGLGEVYLAWAIKMSMLVAIKVLLRASLERDPNAVPRLWREAQNARSVDNDHVVKVLDQGECDVSGDRLPYLVMEYIPGETLSTILKREGPLSAVLAVELVLQVLDGLNAAHQSRIIHRDLSPANIIVYGFGTAHMRVVIIDLGSGRPVGEPEPDDVTARILTEELPPEEQKVFYTKTWAAPEVWRYGVVATPAADICSLGLIAAMVTSGVRPIDPDGPRSLTAICLEPGDPRFLDKTDPGPTPPALWEIWHRMTARCPSDRPSAAQATAMLLDALEADVKTAVHLPAGGPVGTGDLRSRVVSEVNTVPTTWWASLGIFAVVFAALAFAAGAMALSTASVKASALQALRDAVTQSREDAQECHTRAAANRVIHDKGLIALREDLAITHGRIDLLESAAAPVPAQDADQADEPDKTIPKQTKIARPSRWPRRGNKKHRKPSPRPPVVFPLGFHTNEQHGTDRRPSKAPAPKRKRKSGRRGR